MTRTPPVAGMWVVSSEHELTPTIVEHAQEVLEGAVADGRQVVVVEGITLRWRPVEVDTAPALDVDLLERALEAWDHYGEVFMVPNLAAKGIAAEYARLSEDDTA